MLSDNYESYFPMKTFRISVDDEPWVISEMKSVDRRRRREFEKRRKSEMGRTQ